MEPGAYLRALSCCDGYEIAPYDVGLTIKLQLHFDDDVGNHEVIDVQAATPVAAVPPDQPGNLSASLGDPGELNLSWSTPAVCDFTLDFGCWLALDRTFRVADGGSDITGYTVQWKLSSGDWGTASDVSEVDVTDTSYTVTGLTASNTYNVRVRARNVAGLGTPSTEVTVSGTDLNVGPVVTGRARPYFFETNPRDVTTYTVTDAENYSITWMLSGDDAGFFSIANGVLNFDTGGDFEDPQDAGANNAYDVNILASDGQNTATFPVTVVILNVEDERPVITGDDALTFAENTNAPTVLQTYSAIDPEGVYTSFAWSLAGTDAGDFEISSAGTLTFNDVPDFDIPVDSDGDNIYNLQVRAEDGSKTGTLDVTVTVTPVDEPPVITGVTTVDDYDENDTDDVATYTAADPEGDTSITWSLAGSDSGDFDITGGVLTFKNTPDYERPADSGGNNHYEVTVQASDSNNKRGELYVDVIVAPVNEPPTITGPDAVDDFPENSPTSRQVGRYTASDPEGVMVTLSLEGADSDDFTLASNGIVTFKESPDYEEKNSYILSIPPNDGTQRGPKIVFVNIQNVEEPGAITLSSVQPQEGTEITATLEDGDEPTSTTWQWYRTPSRSSTGTAITNATSSSYTPDTDDVGSYLRAVASYDDGFDTGNTAVAFSANRVQEAPPAPEPPSSLRAASTNVASVRTCRREETWDPRSGRRIPTMTDSPTVFLPPMCSKSWIPPASCAPRQCRTTKTKTSTSSPSPPPTRAVSPIPSPSPLMSRTWTKPR